MRNKTFVIINVLGLGIAMSCCIVAYLNYQFEADYNTMHVNRDKIYKINVSRTIDERLQNYGISPISLAPALANQIAGIECIVRLSNSYSPIRYDGKNGDAKIFNESIGFADKDFLRMFTFPMKWGDSDAFEDKSKIILSEKTSSKFFGDKNPVGETVTIFNDKGIGTVLTIGGVFKNIPENSIVHRFNALCLHSNYLKIYNINELDWKEWTDGTFLQVSNPSKIIEIEKSLSQYIQIQNKNNYDWKIEKYYIQSLDEFTKDSRNIWANRMGQINPPSAIIGPIVMAILILLLACFNFINTSIATSNKRLKEIGVRKVIGGSRTNLIAQFLGENFIICFFALIASLLIGVYFTSEYNKMWTDLNLSANYFSNFRIWIFLGFVLVFTTITAALYPAFYISSFNPIQVLRGTVKFSGTGILSRILLILQFSISLIGLIASIVFVQNAKFQNDFYLGYNKDQIITIPSSSHSNIEILQKALENNTNIIQMTPTEDHISFGSRSRTAVYIDKKAEVELFNINTDYCKVMDLKITEGREFITEFESSDVNHSAIVNESLLKEFKLDNPIGKTIQIDTSELVIVGVVKDFYRNLWNPLMPSVMRVASKDKLSSLLVKCNKENLVALNNQIKKEWERLIPNAPYEGVLPDTIFEESRSINENILKIFSFLSVISIFLSIIALFTLISLNINKRTKEIGIRKTMGAPSIHIYYLIGKPFFIMLFMAFIFGGAGGYFLSQMLLKSIWAYHVNANAISVLLPIIIIFILSLITLVLKVYYTLVKNPINSLKYE